MPCESLTVMYVGLPMLTVSETYCIGCFATGDSQPPNYFLHVARGIVSSQSGKFSEIFSRCVGMVSVDISPPQVEYMFPGVLNINWSSCFCRGKAFVQPAPRHWKSIGLVDDHRALMCFASFLPPSL